MVRQLLSLAAVLVLVAGCGEPASDLTLAEKGTHELQAGRYDVAIATCNEALAQNPQDAAAYFTRGRAYHYRNQSGDLDKAIADFTQSIELAPKECQTYYSRSLAYRDKGNHEASAKDELTARELDTKLKETYSELSDLTPPGAAPQGIALEAEEALDQQAKAQEAIKAREASERETDEILERAKARSETNDQSPKSSRARPSDPFKHAPDAQFEASSDEKIRDLLTEPRVIPPAAPASETNSGGVVPTSPRGRTKANTTPMRAGRRPPQRVPAGTARVAPDLQPPPRSGQVPAGAYAGQGQYDAPNYTRPTQSPFPQARPRPTGRQEELDTIQNPYAPAQREAYNNPYSAGPAVQHLPGAYQSDLNP